MQRADIEAYQRSLIGLTPEALVTRYEAIPEGERHTVEAEALREAVQYRTSDPALRRRVGLGCGCGSAHCPKED